MSSLMKKEPAALISTIFFGLLAIYAGFRWITQAVRTRSSVLPLGKSRFAIATMARMKAANCEKKVGNPKATASPIVKNTCIWITSDESPAAIPSFMPRNSRPNWNTPIARP